MKKKKGSNERVRILKTKEFGKVEVVATSSAPWLQSVKHPLMQAGLGSWAQRRASCFLTGLLADMSKYIKSAMQLQVANRDWEKGCVRALIHPLPHCSPTLAPILGPANISLP